MRPTAGNMTSPPPNNGSPGRTARFAAVVMLVLLLGINAYRAWQQSIVHDEAFTYQLYLAGPPSTIFENYTPNLHFLFVILAKLSVTLFGASAFAIRLPTVVAGALY